MCPSLLRRVIETPCLPGAPTHNSKEEEVSPNGASVQGRLPPKRMEDFPGKTCAHVFRVVNTRGNGRHHFLSLHPACRLRVGFNCRGLGKTEGYFILYGATGQRCDLGGIMLQSKDVNTPGSSTITLFPFPPTQYKRLISENRNASFILVIFSFFLAGTEARC